MSQDEQYLRRAIRLAMNGRGKVEPNPMVGCVLVKDGRVIGEGYHTHFGGPHAEPTALASCTESPVGATAYVTLEPCCHTNKKTPPCAPLLIKEKIARVVIGCLDPNPEVNGNGVRMLRDAGIQIDGPVLEAECKQLIAPFLKHVNTIYPYATLKWAESADGKVAGPNGTRLQISNPTASRLVQLLRSRCGGVLVGINTVLNDNPTLLPRGYPIPQKFFRIVVDTHMRVPVDCELARTAGQSDVIVLCGWNAGDAQPDRKRILIDRGVIVKDDIDDDETGRMQLNQWYPLLHNWLDTHLLVEPGPTLAAGMFPVADRLWVIRSPGCVNDATAPAAAAVPDHYIQTGSLDLDGDRLTEYLNTRSPAYFAPVPSADFVLASSRD